MNILKTKKLASGNFLIIVDVTGKMRKWGRWREIRVVETTDGIYSRANARNVVHEHFRMGYDARSHRQSSAALGAATARLH